MHDVIASFLTSDLVKSPSSDELLLSSPSKNPSESDDPNDSFSELSTLDGDELNEELLIENKCFQELETQKTFIQKQNQEDIIVQDINIVVNGFKTDVKKFDILTRKKIRQYQNDINTSQLGWVKLSLETDINILIGLLFEWLENLKQPILKRDYFEHIVTLYKQVELCLQKFAMVCL